jgi:hypothetical protein
MARITGKLASLYLVTPIAGTLAKVGDIFDWTFDATWEMANASVKGDVYERFQPSHASARITAQRYVNTGAEIMDAVTTADANTLADHYAFRLDLIDASSSFTQIAGTAYIARNALSAPRGVVVENFEMQVDGLWTATAPGAG